MKFKTITLGRDAPLIIPSFPSGLITLQIQMLQQRDLGDPQVHCPISSLIKHPTLLVLGREFGVLNNFRP